MEIQTNTDTANSNGEELRNCNSCGCKKLLKVHFSIRKNTNEYYKSCNKCVERQRKEREKRKEKNKEYQKQYREKNKEQQKQYRQDNKEAILIKQKQWREENKEQIKQHYQDNKEAIALYNKKYHKDKRHYCEHNTSKKFCKICSPLSHLKHLATDHIRKALNNYNGKNNRTVNYLCCTIEEYREYLENQFTSDMTWDNMGSYWQVDHIIPVLYKMDGQNPTEADIIERLKYTNTQPMKAEHNISKGNRYIGAYRPDF